MANSAAGKERIAPGIMTCYALTHRSSKPCGTREHPCPLEVVKKKKKPVIVEHIHYDKDGNLRNFEVHAYPIFDSNGNVVQMIEYCLDTTEHRQMENKLQESEEKYRGLVENTTDIIYSVDMAGNITSVNKASKAMLGLEPEEAIGRNVVEFIPRKTRPKAKEYLRAGLGRKEAYR